MRFTDLLEGILDKISKDKILSKADEIQIMGDFNINLLNHGTHASTSNFINTLLTYSQISKISLPTRITPTSATL